MLRLCQRCHERHDIPTGCHYCSQCRDAVERRRRLAILHHQFKVRRRSTVCRVKGCQNGCLVKRGRDGFFGLAVWCHEHANRYLDYGDPCAIGD
jgi:hypothetical protein